MKVTVKGRIDDITIADARGILNGARRAVRSVSFAVERAVKLLMPVDTGRARASWGHWTPEHLRGNEHASPADAHWEESNDGLSTTQGSNVEYVVLLNDGHSRQQGAGFIDSAAERGMRELDRAIDNLFRGI